MPRRSPFLLLLAPTLLLSAGCLRPPPATGDAAPASGLASGLLRASDVDARFAAAARGAPPCAARIRTASHSRIEARLAGTPDAVFARVLATYLAQGHTVAVADSTRRRVTSAPRWAWDASLADEPWHGPEHPGVQLLTQVVPIGTDSSLVAVAARALCRVRAPGAAEPSEAVGEQLRMLTALMVATALGGARPAVR